MCKVCNQCKVEYCEDIEKHFYPHNRSKDGLAYICKYCNLTNKHKIVHIDEDGKLLCLHCECYKDESEFNIGIPAWYRHDRDRRCKECKKLQYEKRRIANRGDLGIERLLTERFVGLRDRAIRNGLVVDFDKEYLRELWITQNQRCAISGVEMTTVFFSGRVPSNMSVDRIDSEKGYIRGNVQLVCMAVNQMKSDLSNEELLFFCNKIVENSKL